jgi:pyridoxine 5-phosphate synthase
MTRLSINLNKVALVRNARDLGIPSLVTAARACLAAGAHGITVHPRPDGRHVVPADVRALGAPVREFGAELNVEGYPSDDLLALVCETRPDQCTLVPDAPGQRTSDHGWDVARHRALLERAARRLHDAGVRVSLFVDAATPAEAARVPLAREVGADRVELYTEPWARAHASASTAAAAAPGAARLLDCYADAAARAARAGLGVNAGHDLSLRNLPPFVAAVPELAEVSIGHAFIADALEVGYGAAVRAYLTALGRPHAVRSA